MTHRGPFHPLLFCHSVILWSQYQSGRAQFRRNGWLKGKPGKPRASVNVCLKIFLSASLKPLPSQCPPPQPSSSLSLLIPLSCGVWGRGNSATALWIPWVFWERLLSNLLAAKHYLVQATPGGYGRWQFREQPFLYYHETVSFSFSNRQRQECGTDLLLSLLLNCDQECYNCKIISLININSNWKKNFCRLK